jgi:hypothetical protein
MDTVYKMRQHNSISIVYEEKGEVIIIHVINETGNIFSFIKPLKLKDRHLIAMLGFCKNIIKKVNASTKNSWIGEQIIVYSIRTDRFGKLSAMNETQTIEDAYQVKNNIKSGVAAVISIKSPEETVYDIKFPDGSSSGPLSINDVPKAGEKITAMRETIEAYGIIHDIKFTEIRGNILAGSTIFLLEKYKLEFMLDKSLKKG